MEEVAETRDRSRLSKLQKTRVKKKPQVLQPKTCGTLAQSERLWGIPVWRYKRGCESHNKEIPGMNRPPAGQLPAPPADWKRSVVAVLPNWHTKLGT